MKVSDILKSTKIQLLRDSVVTLPNGIQLIGRDDRHNRKRRSLQELMVNIDKSKPIILLDHQPFDLEETKSCRHRPAIQRAYTPRTNMAY